MTSRAKPYPAVWTPPSEDRVETGWAPPEAEAVQAPTQKPPAPSWGQALFPSSYGRQSATNAQGEETGGALAGIKDLAALPANVLAGLYAAIGAPPGMASEEARAAMASKGEGNMSQNQRAVIGLSIAGAPLGGAFEAALPAIRSSAPLVRGLSQLVRGAGAGAVETIPAAAYQTATGDIGGGLGNLAIGGLAGGIMRGVGMGAKGVDRASGSLAESMAGLPKTDLRKIGFLGNSEYGQKILSVAGNRKQHLDDLVGDVLNGIKHFDQNLPDATAVDEMVRNLPDVSSKSLISALEKSKTAIKLKGKPGSVSRGTADIFASTTPTSFTAPASSEVYQDFAQIGGPGTMVPFSNLSTKQRPGLSGLLGMDKKGLPSVRSNPQVIADPEPIGSAAYSINTKGVKGKSVNIVPEDRMADRKIDDLIQMVKQVTDANGYMPATVARQIKQRYDAAVGDAFGKESSAYLTALKNGRHDIAQTLENAANESGVPEYALMMADYTRKYRARDAVLDKLGYDQRTQADRAEAYLSNLFQGNKTHQQKAFAELSDIMGADFAERAKLLSDAKRIAPTGSIPLISAHKTGKAGLGGGVGGAATAIAMGHPLLALPALAGVGLSSPSIAPGILWGTEKAAQAAANPYVSGLGSLLGRAARAELQAKNAGQ